MNVGMFVARHLKGANDLGSRWFKVHSTIQSAGAVLILGSAVLIFSHLVASNEGHFESLHAKLGLAVVILLVFQVSSGITAHLFYLRQKSSRAFHVVHRYLGRFTWLLAHICIVLGLLLLADELHRDHVHFVVWAALFVYALVFVSFSGLMEFRRRQRNLPHDDQEEYEMMERPQSKPSRDRYAPQIDEDEEDEEGLSSSRQSDSEDIERANDMHQTEKFSREMDSSSTPTAPTRQTVAFVIYVAAHSFTVAAVLFSLYTFNL